MIRFLIYGLIGWCAEVVWTAAYDAVSGTRRAAGDRTARAPLTRAERVRLEGKSYLWMFPVYGGGLLLFERAHALVALWPWPLRGAVYAAGAFAVEGAAGLALRAATGRIPWDYSYARWSRLGGAIRLDYAPVWLGFGLLLEPLTRLVAVVEPALRAAW